MVNKIFSICLFGVSVLLVSCDNTGNEANKDTNTHNTSQPSSAATTEDIVIDARSMIPASRLNDGNLETRAANRSNIPQGYSSEGVEGAGVGTDMQDGQADVLEEPQLQENNRDQEVEENPNSEGL